MSKAFPLTEPKSGGYILAGLLAIGALVGSVGGWAAFAPLNAAVIASGEVAVDTNSKRIQHPEGGVVGRIAVREGQAVGEGDLLLRLDDTVTRASLMIIDGQLISFHARKTRLDSERADLDALTAPPALAARMGEEAVRLAFEGEANLFEARRRGREGETAQLRERILQSQQETVGLDARIEAKAGEMDLIGAELRDLEGLFAKGLVPVTRVMALRRERTRIQGERGQLIAEVARVKGQGSETELKILQVDRDFRTEIAKDLRETETHIAELTEKKVAAEDRLKRIDVRSPRAGYVHQLQAHTVGGVIAPSDVLMFIVPKEDVLTVEARVAPQDVDQLRLGQEAVVRLSGLNHRTAPELTGSVERIAADLTHDPKTSQSYFSVRVSLTEAQLQRLPSTVTLLPGMPAEIFVQTAARTALDYMVEPLTAQFAHALREE